jgi:ankyrin repeat protein
MADITTVSLGHVMLADREARIMATEEQLTDIVAAAREGNADEVVRLLDAQPDLLEANSTVTEYSLLFETSMAGHMDIAKVLLERGANVNSESPYGETPLFMAAGHGHEEMAVLLLGAGADVRRRRDPTCCTPLMAASLQGFLGMTRLILRHMRAAGLDDTNGDGRTALWFSCTFRRTEVLRALLLAGADCTIADHSGTSPQEAALNPIGRRAPRQHEVTCLDVFEVRAYSTHTCTWTRAGQLIVTEISSAV